MLTRRNFVPVVVIPGNYSPVLLSLVPDVASPQTAGATVTFTATGDDVEDDPLEYRFYLDGVAQTEWGSGNTWAWETDESDLGPHTFMVRVRDNNHSATGDYSETINYTINSASNNPPQMTGIVSGSPSPQPAGSIIIFTASASDLENDPLEYMFLLDGVDQTGFTSSPSWIWATYGAAIGTHIITVYVRDNNHNPLGDSTMSTQFTIASAPNQAPSMVGLSANPPSPQPACTLVTFTASASDLENDPLEYMFLLDGIAQTDFTSSRSWTWSTAGAAIGTHIITVYVRDNNHNPLGDSTMSTQFTIELASSNPPQVVGLSANPPSPQTTCASVTFTASASDLENDPLEYMFLLDGVDQTGFTSSPSWIWATAMENIGSHTIGVWVRDNKHNPEGDSFMSTQFSINPPETELVRDAYGPFLSLRDGDPIFIKPWEACPRDIDMVTLYPLGGDVYALQMPNGKYMSATNGGGSTITCDADYIGPNEQFTFQWIPGNDSYLIWCPDGVHGLDAPNQVGQYLTAYYAPGGCSGQFCFHKFEEFGVNKYSVWAYCSDGIGPGIFWPELSRPDGLPTYQQIDAEIIYVPEYVNGAWGPFLTLRDGDGIHIKPWEAFPRDVDMITMHHQGGNVYAIQLPNGKYMSATNGGGSTITCDAVTIGPNEQFTFQWIPGNDSYLIWCPDGIHGLDAPNCVGQYLTAYYAPGGWSGQFCFHKNPEYGGNKYSVWAYCSDGIGPGVYWPELSRPSGLPTYQQIDVTPSDVIDIFEYVLCDDSTYMKPTAFTQNGNRVHSYWRYYNSNGDIDLFTVRWDAPWNMEYTKYFASEQLIRFMYDCEDSQPNVDCGEACRFSMRESDTLKPSIWMKRFWTVGEIIDCSNSEGTSWHNDKTPCYPWSGPGYKSQLFRKFSEDFGGLVGVRDAIETHWIILDNNNEEVRREVSVYAKGWGYISWCVLIDGVRQSPFHRAIWSATAPKVLPDFASVCPEVYQVPPGY
ncbi:MAG: hypothetical protein WC343_07170 [Bacilli bacterium]|jgi:hypothetical protein